MRHNYSIEMVESKEIKPLSPRKIKTPIEIGNVIFNNNWYTRSRSTKLKDDFCGNENAQKPSTLRENVSKDIRDADLTMHRTLARFLADQKPKWFTQNRTLYGRLIENQSLGYTKHWDFDKYVRSGDLQKKFDNDLVLLREKCERILKGTESRDYITDEKPSATRINNANVSNRGSEKIKSGDLRTLTRLKKQMNFDSNSSRSGDEENQDLKRWPLRPSLFPNVPPYLTFSEYNSDGVRFPHGQRLLKWRATFNTPTLVKKTLHRSGISLIRGNLSRDRTQWIGTWGPKGSLKKLQKFCHFPGSHFDFKRKDMLWYNFKRLIIRFGYHHFDFLPPTFILPADFDQLKRNWNRWEKKTSGNTGETWLITKPPGLNQGKNIRIISDWSELPSTIDKALVVQRYIKHPLLINERKFTLRVYVLVTSFNPLRIYLYTDGLALFATAKYSKDRDSISNSFVHLTNYFVNKHSPDYFDNPDPNSCQGYEWTLKKLFEFMQLRGIDTRRLWWKIRDITIKTMISGEASIYKMCKDRLGCCSNYYELYGLDYLFDDKLNVWLLESNIYPGLDPNPVEDYVHGPMLKSMFDLVQFHLPQGYSDIYYPGSPPCLDPKLRCPCLTEYEKKKHNKYLQTSRTAYLREILMDLTGDDVRQLIRAEDEYTVKGQFEIIFPTSDTYHYLDFMEPRYYNRLFDAWETKFENNRSLGIALLKKYCEKKIHLDPT